MDWRKADEIDLNRREMYPGESTIDLIDIFDLEVNKPEHVSDKLDCQGEQDNLDDQDAGCEEDPEFQSFGYLGNLNLNGEKGSDQFKDYKYKKICLPTISEMNQATRMLVPEQMNVLRKVVASCKSMVRAARNTSVKPKPVRLIVHGGAGKDKCFFHKYWFT